MQVGMNVAEEYTATQGAFPLTQLYSNCISLLCAGNAAAYQDQVSARSRTAAMRWEIF